MASQAVLLDTDVYSAVYITPRETAERQGHPVETWSELLTGRRALISFQTRAEILGGALSARWGERRLSAACAIAKSLPLLAGDGIYANAPGLTLLEADEA